eukprot:scaffold252990_cov63-Attheya_sp.AAC.2
MTEVVLQTSKLRTIEPHTVDEIAFVFKEQEVSSGERGFCRGRTHALILFCYKIIWEEDTEVLMRVFDHECLPFASDYMLSSTQDSRISEIMKSNQMPASTTAFRDN